ncbi:MAG: LCP family protein [Clostridium sp.]
MRKNSGHSSEKEKGGNKEKITREDFERRKLLKKKAKKKARKLKIMAALITLFIVIIIVPIFVLSSFITTLDSGDLLEGISPKSKQSLNILMLGMDIGDVNQVENKAVKNTDTIMVLNYNPSTKKASLVSVPRDTQIEVDAYDGYGNLRSYWKINSAYMIDGVEEVTKQVENLLDINLNYVVKVDYNAFRNFIDAIGGVKMYIEQDMIYDDEMQNLHINFKGGETVKLDGKKAEEFFRWRGNNDHSGLADGDLGRIKNQQSFINAVIKKCLNPITILKMPKILDVVKEDIETNMPAKKIVSYGLKFVFNKGIAMNTLQGYPETHYKESFLVVDKEDNKEIIDSLKSGTKSDGGTNKTNYNILVLNCTNTNGLAGSIKTKMESLGYKKVEVDNGENTSKSTIISNNKDLKEQLKSDVGIKKFDENNSNDYASYDAVIILGNDYKAN